MEKPQEEQLPKVCQKKPYTMEVEEGTYAWCSCGLSQKQPFCDGSHKGTGFAPVIEKVIAKKIVHWCGCKHTTTKPHCDGTHTRVA